MAGCTDPFVFMTQAHCQSDWLRVGTKQCSGSDDRRCSGQPEQWGRHHWHPLGPAAMALLVTASTAPEATKPSITTPLVAAHHVGSRSLISTTTSHLSFSATCRWHQLGLRPPCTSALTRSRCLHFSLDTYPSFYSISTSVSPLPKPRAPRRRCATVLVMAG